GYFYAASSAIAGDKVCDLVPLGVQNDPLRAYEILRAHVESGPAGAGKRHIVDKSISAIGSARRVPKEIVPAGLNRDAVVLRRSDQTLADRIVTDRIGFKCRDVAAQPRPRPGVVLRVGSCIDPTVGREDEPAIGVERDCTRVGVYRRAVRGISTGDGGGGQRNTINPKGLHREWRSRDDTTGDIDQICIARIDRDGKIDRRLTERVDRRHRKRGPGPAGISRPEKSGYLVGRQIDDADGNGATRAGGNLQHGL